MKRHRQKRVGWRETGGLEVLGRDRHKGVKEETQYRGDKYTKEKMERDYFDVVATQSAR